jgi:hypothetical protein
MQIYCPKCRQLTTSTSHRYLINGRVVRVEEVCDKCHCTIRVDHHIRVRVEPSSRLSEIGGFPYYIERSFTANLRKPELHQAGIIDEMDIRRCLLGIGRADG